MIAPLAFALALLPALPQEGDVELSFDVPSLMIEGEPFEVTIRAVAGSEQDASIPAWVLTAAVFDLEGVSLGRREAEVFVPLASGQRVETTLDLTGAVSSSEAFQSRDFRLKFAPSAEHKPIRVHYLRRAERGIEFMQLPAEQLGDYDVVFLTSHGIVWVQLWPDVAPQHARNFLDLAYTGFYDDNQFHRVIPGFMVQGGGAKPGKPAPRRLKNEFNDRRHVPGVLSMARLGVDTVDPEGNTVPAFDSATCEFFVVHKTSPNLDGQYTAFGKVVFGMEAIEEVVASVKDYFQTRDPRTHKPRERQEIERAIVVKAPARRPGEEGR